jgi:polyhydroxybutyrate depolymerase
MFHGFNGNGPTLMDESQMNAAADRAGYAVAYPDGTGRFRYAGLTWNAVSCCGSAVERHVDDIGFAGAIVDELVGAGYADASRVYAAGFSAGGMMALRLACTRARTYAAVADVAGAMPDTACVPARAVPVLLIQGEDDSDLRDDQSTKKHRKVHRWSTALETALVFWGRVGGCAPALLRDTSTTYVRLRASSCPPGGEATLVTVHDHPHAWPGGRPSWLFGARPAPVPNASEMVLEFFDRHRSGAQIH